jgi:hypothetical protein
MFKTVLRHKREEKEAMGKKQGRSWDDDKEGYSGGCVEVQGDYG